MMKVIKPSEIDSVIGTVVHEGNNIEQQHPK